MDKLGIRRVNGYDPVLLEEDKDLDNLSPTSFRNGHVDHSEHVLPIVIHLRPLVSMDDILNRIIVRLNRCFRSAISWSVGLSAKRSLRWGSMLAGPSSHQIVERTAVDD